MIKNLYCATCDVPHDLDMAPDEGTCLLCGGMLIEDPEERELVGTLQKAINNAVADGLAAVAIATRKNKREQS